MKTVLTQQELAERWGVTVKTITEYRTDGILQPVKGIPIIRFSLDYIQQLEGTTIEKFSPLERSRLTTELEKVQKENEKLKNILGGILSEASKVITLNNQFGS